MWERLTDLQPVGNIGVNLVDQCDSTLEDVDSLLWLKTGLGFRLVNSFGPGRRTYQ